MSVVTTPPSFKKIYQRKREKIYCQLCLLCILGDPGAVSRGGKISSPEFFSRPFRLFPAPTNCPWVSQDAFCAHVEVNRKTLLFSFESAQIT